MLDTAKSYEVVEYHVDSKTSVDAVLHMAKLQRVTGELTIAFRDGGIRTIVLIQKTLVGEPSST